jgi:CPA2 family monovalent cation:H+ antiporter-2
VQDLAAVVLVALLPRVVGSSGAHPLDLLIIVGKALAFIAVVLFLGVRVVPLFMARVERLRSPELFLLTAVTLALGAATISALLGLSTALGAFLGGLLLAETDFDHRVIAEIVPMRNLFASLFFVSVGMLIDPDFIVMHLPAVIGLTLFIVSAKALLTMGAVLPFKLGGKTAVFTSLGMIQIGEFSYVLASAGRAAGAISADFTSLILASSVATILLTPAAFQVAPHVERLLERAPGLGPLFLTRPMLAGDEETLRDYAVVVGYGRVGSYVTQGLRESGLPVVVIEQDMHLAQLLRSENVPVVYGDASSAVVLGAAHVERARLVVIALPDSGATREVVRHVRRVNASAPILARSAREEDEETLTRLGVTQVIAPERAGAQLLLESCLQAVGVPTAVALNEPGQPVLE